VEEPYRTLGQFLLFGQRVRTADLSTVVSPERLAILHDLGLMGEAEDEIWLERLCLLDLAGNLAFVSLKRADVRPEDFDVYAGPDSLLLAHWAEIPRGATALDLGAGTGVQAMAAARRASRVVAVEMNPRAWAVAGINVALNALDHKVDVRRGDLYEPVADEVFDVVLSNPAFIPFPRGEAYPLPGAGGEDGLDMVRRIVEGFVPHSRPDGVCHMVLEAVGSSDRPERLCSLLSSWADDGREAALWILSRERCAGPVLERMALMGSLYTGEGEGHREELLETLTDFYERRDYRNIFDCLVTLRRTGTTHGLTVVDLTPIRKAISP
jgi:SAM-dependent methyltransferase